MQSMPPQLVGTPDRTPGPPMGAPLQNPSANLGPFEAVTPDKSAPLPAKLGSLLPIRAAIKSTSSRMVGTFRAVFSKPNATQLSNLQVVSYAAAECRLQTVTFTSLTVGLQHKLRFEKPPKPGEPTVAERTATVAACARAHLERIQAAALEKLTDPTPLTGARLQEVVRTLAHDEEREM